MRAAEQASATLKASGPSIFGPFTVAGMRPAYGGTVRIQTERLTPPIARIFQPASGVRRFLRLISTTLREGHSPPARRTRSWMNKTKSGSSPGSTRCTLFGLGTRPVRLDQISAPRQTSRPLQPIRKDLVIRFRRQRLAREAIMAAKEISEEVCCEAERRGTRTA